MAKFVLDCNAVSSINDVIKSASDVMKNLESSISGYDVSNEDFDFSSAKEAIRKNVNAAALKMQNTYKVVNQVIDVHTTLQSSLVFDPVIPQLISNPSVNTLNTDKRFSNSVNGNAVFKKATTSSTKIPNETSKTAAPPASSFVSNNNNNEVKTDTFINTKTEVLETNDNSINVVSNNNYITDATNGFIVTTDNKIYNLSQSDKELLMAIVAAEADKNSIDDCLAVVSVILNRCENTAWVNSHGTNPIAQATAPNQFVVYQEGLYKKYLGGNVSDNVKKAVEDALSGTRNCEYLSFRSNSSVSFSNNMISDTGNRYL